MINEELLREVNLVRSGIEDLQRKFPNMDLSKHYIILAYNYELAGDKDGMLDMLHNVTSEYLINQLVKDMLEACDHFNRAVRKEACGLSGEHDREQSEFFVCASGMLNKLYLIHYATMLKVVEQMKDVEFKLKFKDLGLSVVDKE